MTGLKLAPLTLALLGLVAAVGAAPLDPARTFLKTVFDLSPAEISGVDTGEVISRTLEVTNRREVATLGVVKIKGTPSMYVERLTDIAAFKRTDDVLQIGTFSSTPQLGDVASLTIEEADLKRLRSCRADDCNVRLSAEGIERFRRDVDWHTADASRVGGQLVRQLLVDYVARYRQSGAASAMEYADRAPRMNVGREFALLVDADTVTWKSVPRLRRHLLEYPAPSAGTTPTCASSSRAARVRSAWTRPPVRGRAWCASWITSGSTRPRRSRAAST